MCSPSDRSGINDKKTKNNTTNGWPAFIGRKQVQQQYKKNRQYKQKQHSHFWDLPRTPNNKFESQKKVRVIFASPSDLTNITGLQSVRCLRSIHAWEVSGKWVSVWGDLIRLTADVVDGVMDHIREYIEEGYES